MAISFVGSAVGSSSPNAATQIVLPTLQAGDLIIIAAAVGDTASNGIPAPTGYTRVPGVAATLYGNDTNDTNLDLYYKIAVAGDSGATVTLTATGGTNAANAGVAMVFRGVDTTTPFDVNAATATGIDTSNADPPSLDHGNPSGVWTVIAASTGHTGGAAASFAFPTGYTTNAAQRPHDDSVDVLVGMGYRTNPSDPENPGALTASNIGTASANAWAAVTMALRPATITPTRGRISFSELETYDVPAAWPDVSLADSFNRANGSLGSNWATLSGFTSATVSSNKWNASDATVERWVGNGATSADYSLYATIATLPAGTSGLTVGGRLGADANTRYVVRTRQVTGTNNDQLEIQRGGSTHIGASPYNLGRDWAVGDKVGLRFSGSTIEVWVQPDGGSWNRIDVITDSTFPDAGDPFLGAEAAGEWDDFHLFVPTRGRVGVTELEAPFVATRGRLSFAEVETPLVPTRGRFSYAEIEVPTVATRGRASQAEVEVPGLASSTRGLIAFTELEVPDVQPTRGRISFAEVEAPFVQTRGRASFMELEAPVAPTRGRISLAELQVPDLGGAPVVSTWTIRLSGPRIGL